MGTPNQPAIVGLLVHLTPVVALLNIVTDIIYMNVNKQVLMYTNLFTTYQLCFLIPPLIGIPISLIQLIKDKFEIWKIFLYPIFAWLDMFELFSSPNGLGTHQCGTALLFFKTPIIIIQFMIQSYIVGYSNTWNAFFIIKTICLICQILRRCVDFEKTYKCAQSFYQCITPFIAVGSIISDITYMSTNRQVLQYTGFFKLYLQCFLAIPIMGIMLGFIIQITTNKFDIKTNLTALLYIWLDVFIADEEDKNSAISITIIYVKFMISVIQYMLQLYVMAYTNGQNLFLLIKFISIISQIISRFANCIKKECGCGLSRK